MLHTNNSTDETKHALTPSLIKLLESSIALNTTNSKIIAQHLALSPATIRTQYQRILTVLDVSSRYAALRKFEQEVKNKEWNNT